MRFVIAGSTGFLGSALRDHLAQRGHHVVRLVRGETVSSDESRWNPSEGDLDQHVIEEADVVVNLAGASFVHWPMTASYQQTFVESRVGTTRLLAEAIARAERKPALLAQNGTSYYGDRGDEVLTERSAAGEEGAFLNRITKKWQAATEPASEAGARVCVMRTSAVLSKRGGAFQPLRLIFGLGLGGPVGDGAQYFSTISLTDWVRAVTFLAEHEECSGAYNLSAPNPTTNAEFTDTLGRMLHRPTRLRVPTTPLRKVFPELSPEVLSSVRVEPERLLEAGFTFEHPTLESRLAAALAG